MATSRRDFLCTAGMVSAGFFGLRALANSPLAAMAGAGSAGFGPLQPDVEGLFDLPQGFSYRIFSRAGEEMADGLLVPGMHDGMATFPGPDGRTLLVRNHEIESDWVKYSGYGPKNERLGKVPPEKIYDAGKGIAPNLGGTTTLVFNTRTQELESHHQSLAGTVRNCAGGPTPWGTWVTCEEVNADPEPHAEKWHGYNFEVKPSATSGLVDPVPLKAMGRFRHEAIAVDTNSGIVYETEDLGDGLFYRFIPKVPGQLAAGGKLQALAFRDPAIRDTRNWVGSATFPVGKSLAVVWVDIPNPDSAKLDLRHQGRAAGAATFARGEGAWEGSDGIYFAATSGGAKLLGQVFRYRPSPYEGTAREAEAPGQLELFIEPNDRELLKNCDNLTVAPWGDLVLCEDSKGICRLIGVTPEGHCYPIAANPMKDHELAGVCFSPDGSTLFCNVQKPGFSVAITGPWPRQG